MKLYQINLIKIVVLRVEEASKLTQTTSNSADESIKPAVKLNTRLINYLIYNPCWYCALVDTVTIPVTVAAAC